MVSPGLGPRRVRPSLPFVPALALALGTFACGPGKVGQLVRPNDPTASDALGEGAGRCRMVSSFGEPLVVDWEPHQRANIEESMHDGVAVVAYDCKSLRLLKGCHVSGSYGFMGISKKEQTIRLESADEIVANLPAFGVPLVKSISGELERGSSLDLAMILIGKKRTTVGEATRESLRGGAACEGATHFIKGAFVGAFSMGTSAKGGVKLGVGMLSAASQSSKLGKYRDGAPETCEQAKPTDVSAPASCDALVRLELVAIGTPSPAPGTAGGGNEDGRIAQGSCPNGLVLVEGKCGAADPSKAHTCEGLDPTSCGQQCTLGDAPSCGRLGFMHRSGVRVPKNPERAFGFFERACTAGHAPSCSDAGAMLRAGEGHAKDTTAALPLLTFACEAGVPQGCTQLGLVHYQADGVRQDVGHASGFFRQGCVGGDGVGCTMLGMIQASGQRGPADQAQAAGFFRQGCDGRDPDGCTWLGVALKNGQGVPRDLAASAAAFERGCEAGSATGCANFGLALLAGEGVPADKTRARTWLVKGCEKGTAAVCATAAHLFETGEGGEKDLEAAERHYRAGCTGGDRQACAGVTRVTSAR